MKVQEWKHQFPNDLFLFRGYGKNPGKMKLKPWQNEAAGDDIQVANSIYFICIILSVVSFNIYFIQDFKQL